MYSQEISWHLVRLLIAQHEERQKAASKAHRRAGRSTASRRRKFFTPKLEEKYENIGQLINMASKYTVSQFLYKHI